MRSRMRLVQPPGKPGIVWVAMDDTVPYSYVEGRRRAGEPVRELGWNQSQDGRRTLGRVALGVIRDEREYFCAAGSPVFPIYARSNRTLTVVALALRLADHLRKRLAA